MTATHTCVQTCRVQGRMCPERQQEGSWENPGHTDTHESPQRGGPKALSREQGRSKRLPSFPPLTDATGTRRCEGPSRAMKPRPPQPRVSQPGDRGDSQGTHARNRRKLPTCRRSNASWRLFLISEDMMNPWCGGIPTEQKAGDKPLRVDGPAGTLHHALEAGRVGWRTPGSVAQPHVQTEGSPATLHGLSSGLTPPAAGVGPSAGAQPAAPGGIPRHPCVPLGKPNPRGLWAFRRHPPGGGMPAELGLSPNSGKPPQQGWAPRHRPTPETSRGRLGLGPAASSLSGPALGSESLAPGGEGGTGWRGKVVPCGSCRQLQAMLQGVEGPVLKGSASGLRFPVCGCCFSIGRPRDTFEPLSFKC